MRVFFLRAEDGIRDRRGDWISDVCSFRSEGGDLSIAFAEEGFGLFVGDLEDGGGGEIGRASCRERGQISVVAVSLKKQVRQRFNTHIYPTN